MILNKYQAKMPACTRQTGELILLSVVNTREMDQPLQRCPASLASELAASDILLRAGLQRVAPRFTKPHIS